MRCEWVSMRPGVTARPLRSIRCVAGPASLAICSFVPTARIRPSRTAIATARMVLPLVHRERGSTGSGAEYKRFHHDRDGSVTLDLGADVDVVEVGQADFVDRDDGPPGHELLLQDRADRPAQIAVEDDH